MALTARQQAFFLLALRQRPKSCEALFAFLGKAEAKVLGELYKALKDKRETDIVKVAQSELKKLARPHSLNYLSEVHNDWLVDILNKEDPHVIATVLRYLPAERVQYILTHLPSGVLKSLPKLSDTYATKPEVVDLLRRRFESQFEIEQVWNPEEGFEFAHFSMLRADQIQNTFKELGYREMALGLAGLPEATKKMVVSRLLPKDRMRVEHYLLRLSDAPTQRIKKAQVHLISKDVDAQEPEAFIKELGYIIFAKAILLNETENLLVLKRKLSKREVKALEEAISHYAPSNTEASVLAFREDILLAVKAVLKSPQSAV